ncbi:hypothetical protein STENM327S_03163 [Streptomyces tendae]
MSLTTPTAIPRPRNVLSTSAASAYGLQALGDMCRSYSASCRPG